MRHGSGLGSVCISKFWAWLSLAAPLLAGCASFARRRPAYNAMPREPGRNLVENSGQKPLQCVPYARDHSGVKIFGDAYTWWDQAAGKYPRGHAPQAAR